MGGECLYNKMPCYFKCCVVNSEPQAPQPHCVWRWGVWKLINVQSTPRKDLEKLWGGCSALFRKKQTNNFEKLLYFLRHGYNNVRF